MAELHKALSALAPIAYSDVPCDDDSKLTTFLQSIYSSCQVLIDSVPHPEVPKEDHNQSNGGLSPTTRRRAGTTSSVASNASEMSISSARPPEPAPHNMQLQKEWGKPIKLSAKENPMGMGVYKLGGKDGKGAWFARRSVHEGMAFERWKHGLQSEFPESVEVKGGPGQGNVRGIGGERRVERKVVDGVGVVEVFHLSAQFPGPTTPRDFVTLFLTSDTALDSASAAEHGESTSESADLERTKTLAASKSPRHFLVISKPCQHPDCPPRDGFIRGQYESIEFIREIPQPALRKSVSEAHLQSSAGKAGEMSLDRTARVRSATLKGGAPTLTRADTHHGGPPAAVNENGLRKSRSRGHTISSRETNNPDLYLYNREEETGSNPVEWIMITRSDPGGSVPRFMVERGTPASIVADANKFLDWAARKPHSQGEGVADDDDTSDLVPVRTHMTGLDNGDEINANRSTTSAPTRAITDDLRSIATNQDSSLQTEPMPRPQSSGLLSTLSSAAYSTIESYAPQSIANRLSRDNSSVTQPQSSTQSLAHSQSYSSVSSSSTSIASFASAEDFLSSEETPSIKSPSTPSFGVSSPSPSTITTTSTSQQQTPREKAHAALVLRKQKLEAKMLKEREKHLPKDKKELIVPSDKESKEKLVSEVDKDKVVTLEELPPKDQDKLKKMEEKYRKEVKKAEEKHAKEVAELEKKQERARKKEEERVKREQEKDEKTKLTRERDEAREKLTKAEERIGVLEADKGIVDDRIDVKDQGQKLVQAQDRVKELEAEVLRLKQTIAGIREAIGAAQGV